MKPIATVPISPATEVDADDVERVVVAELELQADGQRAQATPATTPRPIAPSGQMLAQAGVMATRPATTPEAAPREVG